MHTRQKTTNRMSLATLVPCVALGHRSHRHRVGLQLMSKLAITAINASIITLAACGGGGDATDSSSVATTPSIASADHAVRVSSASRGGGGGGGGGAVTPVTPMLTLPTAEPAPGVLVYESFGSGAPVLNLSRPTGGKGTARYVFGSPLNTFWVEYPGGKAVQWIGADGGIGIPSWDFWRFSMGYVAENQDAYSLLTAVDPAAFDSGIAGSTWSPAMGSKVPTALVPFTPPAAAYEVWIDGLLNVNFDTTGGYLAVGLTNSAATANNFETVGQVWLSLRCIDSCKSGLQAYELRLNGRTGPLLATATIPFAVKLVQLMLRYDPAAKVLSAGVNGTSLGDFPLTMAAPSYAGIEGYGIVNNFMIRKVP
jgi:hypothetical protein